MRRSKSFVTDRNNKIVARIEEKGDITVEEICKEFAISPSTARNILSSLQSQGLIVRRHGGAQPRPADAAGKRAPEEETGCYGFPVTNIPEKEAIAREAVKYVEEGDIIAVTGGTTTFLFAKELKKRDNITVVTNSILVARELLSNTSIDIRMCSGIMQHDKGSLCSMSAEEFFSEIIADKLFIGADAISINEGITSGNANISRLEKVIASHSKAVIVLADHTKFNRRLTVDRVLNAEEIDLLIVDSELPEDYLRKIKLKGIKTAIAQV